MGRRGNEDVIWNDMKEGVKTKMFIWKWVYFFFFFWITQDYIDYHYISHNSLLKAQYPLYMLDLTVPMHAQNTRFFTTSPCANGFHFLWYIDLPYSIAGHLMQNIPLASVNFVFELLNACFISEQAICSINVSLAVKYCFCSFEFKPGGSADPLSCDCWFTTMAYTGMNGWLESWKTAGLAILMAVRRWVCIQLQLWVK